jgi:hypothetical protein
MALYLFSWNMLAWCITMALLWPVMFPWLTVAYKIWHGHKEIDEDFADELWTRSFLASGAITVLAIVLLLLDYLSNDWLDMPSGPVHLVYLISFLTLSAGVMYYCFYLEDFFGGLSLTVIYLYMPMALLFILWWLIHWNPLFTYVLSWLKEPTA